MDLHLLKGREIALENAVFAMCHPSLQKKINKRIFGKFFLIIYLCSVNSITTLYHYDVF